MPKFVRHATLLGVLVGTTLTLVVVNRILSRPHARRPSDSGDQLDTEPDPQPSSPARDEKAESRRSLPPAPPRLAKAYVHANDSTEPGKLGDGESASAHRQMLRQMHEAAIAAHRSEARRPEWASKTVASLSPTLKALASQDGFQTSELDCRSKTCLVNVTWKDRASARATFPELLHADYSPPCATEILFPDDGDPAKETSATMVLDCDKPELVAR